MAPAVVMRTEMRVVLISAGKLEAISPLFVASRLTPMATGERSIGILRQVIF